LSAGTVVVEAGARSSALVTARYAHDYARPVMAVPGPVGSTVSVGTHELIRGGRAVLVASVEHVTELLEATGQDIPATAARLGQIRRDRLSP
jgi:DNA processing protein